jgi:DNA-binding MarR family transcriptional regulator
MSKAEDLPSKLTLHVRDHCLCMHVRRAARALAERYDEAVRPAGLTNGQFSLLMSLNRPAPPAMGDVAALLAMDRTTLTANLKPLEHRGLVAVAAESADKRSRRLALTDASCRFLQRPNHLPGIACRDPRRMLVTTGSQLAQTLNRSADLLR